MGFRRPLFRGWIGLLGLAVCVGASGQSFETVAIDPAMNLNGAGSNVDSIAFWEAPDPVETLMFVTGKGNDRVEVWKYPFEGAEQAAILFPANVNGVAVDQETDLLYVTDRTVSVFDVPRLVPQGTCGRGAIGVGEFWEGAGIDGAGGGGGASGADVTGAWGGGFLGCWVGGGDGGRGGVFGFGVE